MIKLWSGKHQKHEDFERLLEPHIYQLYRLASRLTGHKGDAEDLVQDVILKLYPRLAELKNIEKPAPWLNKILYRHFIDKQRTKRRSPIDTYAEDDIAYEEAIAHCEEPMARLESEITQESLQKALDQLSEAQKLVLLLHDVEGYTLQEIHYMQGVAVGTLKSRLHRAQNKLRNLLSKMERFDDIKRVVG